MDPSAPVIDDLPVEPQDGLAEPMPPPPLPVSPAQAWTDPPGSPDSVTCRSTNKGLHLHKKISHSLVARECP